MVNVIMVLFTLLWFSSTCFEMLLIPFTDPRVWSRSDVSRWLQWCTSFYQLDSIDISKFGMNGRGVCLMTRQGFMERAPSSGDVLYGDFSRRVAVSVLQNRGSWKNHHLTAPLPQKCSSKWSGLIYHCLQTSIIWIIMISYTFCVTCSCGSGSSNLMALQTESIHW